MYTSFVDFVFPHLCPGCQRTVHTPGFCGACWKSLDFIAPPFCLLCGNPFSLYAKKICAQCQDQVPAFNGHRSLWRYGPLSRKVIFALKHGRQRYLASMMAHWLLPLTLEYSVDCIMPVPLHWKRLAYRGFNQAALIAQNIAQLSGIPLELHRLKRSWDTPSQSRFSPQQRQENVSHVFTCQALPPQSHVLLIDDVYTTGATLTACAHILKEAGAHHVYALTLAKVVF